MEEMNYFNSNELEDELSIDLKKIFFSLWCKKLIAIKAGIISNIAIISITVLYLHMNSPNFLILKPPIFSLTIGHF